MTRRSPAPAEGAPRRQEPATPYPRIACCIDGSDASRAALAEARRVSAATGGELTLVHVIESPSLLVSVAAQLGGGTVNDPDLEREAARMWLEEMAAEAPGAGAVLLEGDPPDAVRDWARGGGCDLIVAARHRGPVERALLGSFASRVTTDAPCPVLLVPPGDAPPAAGGSRPG